MPKSARCDPALASDAPSHRLMPRHSTILLLLVMFAVIAAFHRVSHAARGELELRATDESGEPTAVRILIHNSRGRPVLGPKTARIGDEFVFDGSIVLKLAPDVYTFRAEKGPEYRRRSGQFQIKSGATDSHPIEMRRYVDMKEEGWWSGDLIVDHSSARMPTFMLSEDLHVANVLTWGNQRRRARPPDATMRQVGRERWFSLTGGRDRRTGSDVTFGRVNRPLELPHSMGEFPSPFEVFKENRLDESVHVHLSRVDCWDLPAWVASGRLHSVGLFHPGMLTEGALDDDVTRPRDRLLFPDPDGVGRWAQQVYFRLLEAGIRMAPAAGSGSGGNDNPVGYHRVYVHCGRTFSAPAWWDGVRAGRVMVTNGPLLRPRVNGQLPGHVFRARTGERLELQVEARLGTQQKIDYLEVIKNGRPVMQVRLDEWAAQSGRLAPILFDASGWMLVRVVARDAKTYRCASSGPFYVEFDSQRRVSRQAVQFFVDWVYERAKRIDLVDAKQRAAVLRYHRAARDFWLERLAEATVD